MRATKLTFVGAPGAIVSGAALALCSVVASASACAGSLCGEDGRPTVRSQEQADGITALGIRVESDGDVGALAGCTTIGGTLSVTRGAFSSGPTSLAGLESVTSIEGNLIVNEADALEALDGLSGVQTIAGSVFIGVNRGLGSDGNAALTSAELPALATLAEQGSVQILNNPALSRIDLGALTSAFDVGVAQNPALESASFDALASARYISFEGSGGAVSLASLATLGEIGTSINGPVTSMSAPVLESAAGSVSFADTQIAVLSLPSLAEVDGGLSVSQNDALTTLELPALTAVNGGPTMIDGNPSLAACTGAFIANVGDCGAL